ncbi:putative glycosyltransferase [Gordonia rhizosphera NBRC 16068]|uniref:Putative glycosyltransferase n=1 Tax=Gordonia rhizosphera NBRC 16068 TaxID=1108045 RepID=K6VWR6_9ACTN|nr:putative glycosyltransferase [Gordonia rhizosphera NBRC 16068]
MTGRVRPGQVHINGKWLEQNLSGTQRYATEMVRKIAETGGLDLVLHVPKGAQPPEWAAASGMKIRYAPVHGFVFEQLYLPVVTIGRTLLNFAGPAPLVKRRQYVTMHDATPFRYPQTYRRTYVWFYFVLYFVLGRTAQQLITVSNFSARDLADVLRLRRDRFLVAECAADALVNVSPSPPDLSLPDRYYLVVGTQARHKNLGAPIQSVAESGRDVVVVGVAAGGRVYSQTSSLERHAIVPGRLSDAELVWLYRNAQALIFPSKYEGFGLPPLEAQVLGCPVVCSRAASLPEVCGDGALFFDPDDPESLLAELEAIETKPGLVESLRRRGTVNAGRFSWQTSASRIVTNLRDG